MSEKTIKELKSSAAVANVMGYLFLAAGVVAVAIGIYNLIIGELNAGYMIGSGIGSFAFGSMLWCVASIAKYLSSKEQ